MRRALVVGVSSSIQKSMEITFDGDVDGRVWVTPFNSPPAGTTLKYQVYIPSGAPIAAVSPYVMDGNWQWSDTWNTQLPTDAWVTLSVTVPSTAALPLNQVGLKIYLSGPYSGPIYLDAVSW